MTEHSNKLEPARTEAFGKAFEQADDPVGVIEKFKKLTGGTTNGISTAIHQKVIYLMLTNNETAAIQLALLSNPWGANFEETLKTLIRGAGRRLVAKAIMSTVTPPSLGDDYRRVLDLYNLNRCGYDIEDEMKDFAAILGSEIHNYDELHKDNFVHIKALESVKEKGYQTGGIFSHVNSLIGKTVTYYRDKHAYSGDATFPDKDMKTIQFDVPSNFHNKKMELDVPPFFHGYDVEFGSDSQYSLEVTWKSIDAAVKNGRVSDVHMLSSEKDDIACFGSSADTTPDKIVIVDIEKAMAEMNKDLSPLGIHSLLEAKKHLKSKHELSLDTIWTDPSKESMVQDFISFAEKLSLILKKFLIEKETEK